MNSRDARTGTEPDKRMDLKNPAPGDSLKLSTVFLCVSCEEIFRPDPKPFGRRECPSCASTTITPLAGLLTAWPRPWRPSTPLPPITSHGGAIACPLTLSA
jgi:hypothetical protein